MVDLEKDPEITSQPRNFWAVISRVVILILIAGLIDYVLSKSMSYGISRICSNTVFLFLLYFFVIRKMSLSFSYLALKKDRLVLNLLIGLFSGYLLALLPSYFLSGSNAIFNRYNPVTLPIMVLFMGILSINGLACIFIALAEELAFRSIILQKASVYFKNSFFAVIFTVVLFTLFHVDYLMLGSWKTFLYLVFTQFLMSFIFLWRKNVMLLIAWHYAYDITIMFYKGISYNL